MLWLKNFIFSEIINSFFIDLTRSGCSSKRTKRGVLLFFCGFDKVIVSKSGKEWDFKNK